MFMKVFKNINKKVLIILFVLVIFFIFILLGLNANKLTANVIENVLIENENIKLTIENTNFSNNIADFNYQDTKRLKVEVDFKDSSSEAKKVVINIKEGLTYKLYPVLLDPIDSDMQIQISENDIIYGAISNVNYPTIGTTKYLVNTTYQIKDYKSSYGELEYYIKPNIEKITLYIDVAADLYKLYEPTYNEETNSYNNKLIENAINISAYIGKETLNSVDLSTRIITDNKLSLSLKKSSYNKYSTSVFSSSDTEKIHGYTRTNDFRIKADNKPLTLGFPNFKSAIYTLYYPKYTKFVNLVDETGAVIENCKKLGEEESSYCTFVDIPSENDNEDNKVVITLNNNDNNSFINEVAIEYEVNTITEIGIGNDEVKSWVAKEQDNIKIIHYDGTEKTYYANGVYGDVKESLDIYHPDSFVNKMQIKTQMDIEEDKDNSTFVYGPSFVVENKTAGEKTNQVVEYEIGSNYEAIAVTFPRERGVTLTNIEYKTNTSDEWQKYNHDSFDGTVFSLENAGISLDSDTYFTAVKGVVSSYSSGYVTTFAAGKSYLNYVVYGNLKDTADSENVKLRMYEKPETGEIDNNTLVESTAKVKYNEEKTIGGDSDVSFKNDEGKKITSVFTDEDFHITGFLSPHIYPYGTRLYMDNTEIYIKQPKGMTIDLKNIVIKDENGNDLKYERITKTNYHGDTVYVFKTEKRTGLDVAKEGILNLSRNKIIVDVKYHVDENCKINNIELHEVISFGNPDYTFVQGVTVDTTDINANNNISENVFKVFGDSLSIVPAKKFSISSYVEKDGIVYDSYNENNMDTIIEVKPNNVFDYVINVKNNKDESIDEYSLYVPIAKKGTNYGENYQSEPFNWDMSLVEELLETDKYYVYYSTDKDTKNIVDPVSMNYVKEVEDKSLVTMVKIVSKEKVEKGEKYKITFKVKIDKETANENTTKINLNNIVYNISSSTLVGTFKGNSNAFRLYSPSISGFIFNDLSLDKKYDDKDIPVIGNVNLKLYKLNNNIYEKLTDINVDPISGYFMIDDINLLDKNTYALEVSVDGYNLYSDFTQDGWIKDILLEQGNSYYYEIGFLYYELDFSLDDEIIAVGEKSEISVKDIKPSYFEQIKNEESAYFWSITEDESAYLKIEDKNAPSITIEGLKETQKDVKLCVKILDMYNKEKQVCSNIKVKEKNDPIIQAEDMHILIGSKIEYEKYIIEARDYKENKIKLDFNSNVKITTNVIQENGIASKVGVYDIIFEITDVYGNKASKAIKLYVDPISAIITNPSTYDDIIKDIILIIISSVLLATSITIIIFRIKKQDK